MKHDIELAYVGIETADPAAINRYLGDIVGLQPGEPSAGGHATWRADHKAYRLIVQPGSREDAAFIGFEAVHEAAFERTRARLAQAGFALAEGSVAACRERRVERLLRTEAPWGVQLELALGLAQAPSPFHSPHFPQGFVTHGQGFGHAVFTVGTEADYQAAIAFARALGLRLSDWLDMPAGPGRMQVSFFHCNPRHHSLAVAFVPIGEVPQRLHHINFEVSQVQWVGEACERALAAGAPVANLIGQHDNDGMVSFYGISPAGWKVEIGATGRVIDDDWNDVRAYDRISRWGHHPPAALAGMQNP